MAEFEKREISPISAISTAAEMWLIPVMCSSVGASGVTSCLMVRSSSRTRWLTAASSLSMSLMTSTTPGRSEQFFSSTVTEAMAVARARSPGV